MVASERLPGEWMPVNGCQWMVASERLPVDGCQWMDASGWLPVNVCQVNSCQWMVTSGWGPRVAPIVGTHILRPRSACPTGAKVWQLAAHTPVS